MKKVPKSKDDETLKFWKGQIEAAQSNLEKYHDRGCKIEKRYREDRPSNQDNRINTYTSSYPILYSNTETIRPVIFSETPEPDVRAVDLNSIAAREAAQMQEDVLGHGIKQPATMEALHSCVLDYLLSGMGVMRVRYNPTIEQEENTVMVETETGDISESVEIDEKLLYEEISYEYVHWMDVLFPNFRQWCDLPWLGFRGLYTYDAAVKEFGKATADKFNYCYSDKEFKDKKKEHYTPLDNKFGLAEVWEIWDKTNRQVVWVTDSKDIKKPIRINKDPLDLDDFYPVPRPLFSVQTPSQIVPIPFYVFYQDLANELDEVSTRIRRIVKDLKRRGVYDGSFSELQNLATAGDDTFIAVKDFARMQGQGGIEKVIAAEDITGKVGVLQSLYQQRGEIIQAIFQITGFSDILRGQTDPRETLGAQRIKGRFGTLRISKMQREVQRFIRDGLRIASQIVTNRFESKTIALMTAIPMEKVETYQEILEQTEPASVMIDVQTDSTIAADDIADKESVVEFTRAINEFVAAAPQMTQTLGLQVTSEMLMMMLKKFKMGRNIEQAVLDRVQELTAQAQQPKPPSPEEQEAQMNIQKTQAELALKQAELQLKAKELEIRAAEVGLKDQNEKTKLELQAVETALKNLALMGEMENPTDNAFVGV